MNRCEAIRTAKQIITGAYENLILHGPSKEHHEDMIAEALTFDKSQPVLDHIAALEHRRTTAGDAWLAQLEYEREQWRIRIAERDAKDQAYSNKLLGQFDVGDVWHIWDEVKIDLIRVVIKKIDMGKHCSCTPTLVVKREDGRLMRVRLPISSRISYQEPGKQGILSWWVGSKGRRHKFGLDNRPCTVEQYEPPRPVMPTPPAPVGPSFGL